MPYSTRSTSHVLVSEASEAAAHLASGVQSQAVERELHVLHCILQADQKRIGLVGLAMNPEF